MQTPETILLSVISLLHSPNDESPANVEAARLWREEKAGNKDPRKLPYVFEGICSDKKESS